MSSHVKFIFVVKSHILSFVFIVIAGQFVNAQKFSLGVKAGPLLTTSSYGNRVSNSDFDPTIKFGYYGAGIVSFPLKDNYDCVIEGGFSRKTRELLISDGNIRNSAHNNFFDGVLLLRKSFRMNIAPNIPGNWFVDIGPHISYWMGGKGTIGSVDSEGKPYNIVFSDTFDIGDFNSMFLINANRWLFGLDIGVGFNAPITQRARLLTELRFTWGHTFYGRRDSEVYYSWVEFEDSLLANERILALTISYIWDVDLQARKKGHSSKDKEVHRKPVKKRR